MFDYIKETKDWCKSMPYPHRDKKMFTANNLLRIFKEYYRLRYENDILKIRLNQCRQIILGRTN